MKLFYKIFNRISRNSMFHWNIIRLIPDSFFLKLKYKIKVGENLNLKNPVKFNEKLQFIKLNYKDKKQAILVDKLLVRTYITDTIGDKYLNQLIAVYDYPKEIDWDNLPNSFVLKCTHGSGCNIICKDKKNLNINKSMKLLNMWMKTNYFYYGREYPYKKLIPRIICEEYLDDSITDYKFYCFNGVPKFLYTSQFSGRDGEHLGNDARMNFYDLNWELCNFYRKDHKPFDYFIEKPSNFNEMIEIAKKLSKELDFARIDLFNVNGKIYFSEITLTPGSGFTPFSPIEQEIKIGNYLSLRNISDK